MPKVLVNLLSLLVLIFITTLCILTLAYMLGLQLLLTIALFAVPIFFKKRWFKWWYIFYKTLPRDVIAVTRFLKLNLTLYYWNMRHYTVPQLFEEVVKQNPKKVCFYFEDTEWTFEEVNELSNKIARYFKNQGLQKGDTVSLVMENRAEYASFWVGLSKIGVVTALINTNLVNQPLLHSLTVSNSKAIIFSSDYVEAIRGVKNNLDKDIKLCQYNTKENVQLLDGSIDLETSVKNTSGKDLKDEWVKTRMKDKIMYVFTSGTTGLPKAAVITQMRFCLMSVAVQCMMRLRTDDIIYDPLPLYHSSGSIVGLGQAILYANTVVIRKKFSASNYFKDCVKYKCTVAQYIGELCRYLLAVPPGDSAEKTHIVRRMYGNGLKPQIWKSFVDRFGIKEIGEFYGATEGNSNIVNFDGVPGAVGFKPRYAGDLYPIYLIKYHEKTGEPLRNEKGFCIPCGPNEPGIFVGKINKKKAVSDFAGYTDKQATKKKCLENVFRKGDCFFNSGDVLVMDELGYYYFKDRTGDTFRWKGENVATTEVEAVISNVVKLQDAVVYGVQIPNTDGRCGMAAIVDSNDILNLKDLAVGLRKNLPSYACPLFLRVLKKMPLTGTFKLRKIDLQADGFNVDKINDKLYFYDSKLSDFVPLTKEIYTSIMEGKIRL